MSEDLSKRQPPVVIRGLDKFPGPDSLKKPPGSKLRGLEKFKNPDEIAEEVGETATETEVDITSVTEPVLVRGYDKFKKREMDRSITHAPTWKLEFGKHGTGYGSLKADGFEARNTNRGEGQDAFAVSLDRRRFAVADGLGGGGLDKEATRFLAKYAADQAATRGVDIFFDEDTLLEFYAQAEDEFESVNGRGFELPGMLRGYDIAASTLTYAEILDKKDSSTRVRIVTIGDSPAFMTDEALRPIQQLGEDAQKGEPSDLVGYSLGIDSHRKLKIPRKGETRGGVYIVDQVLEVPDSHYVVLGSDYFSDNVHSNYAPLSDFTELSAEEFHSKVASYIEAKKGKSDDATFVVIDPARLP